MRTSGRHAISRWFCRPSLLTISNVKEAKLNARILALHVIRVSANRALWVVEVTERPVSPYASGGVTTSFRPVVEDKACQNSPPNTSHADGADGNKVGDFIAQRLPLQTFATKPPDTIAMLSVRLLRAIETSVVFTTEVGQKRYTWNFNTTTGLSFPTRFLKDLSSSALFLIDVQSEGQRAPIVISKVCCR